MNPVIVDLLPMYQVVIHPDDVTIVGKFIVETASLSMSTAEIRAHSIIQELAYAGIDHPEPMTFFVPVCWQSFAIVAAVAAYYGQYMRLQPRVITMDNQGVMTDLVEFYNGGMFMRHRIRKEVRPNHLLSKKGILAHVSNVPKSTNNL